LYLHAVRRFNDASRYRREPDETLKSRLPPLSLVLWCQTNSSLSDEYGLSFGLSGPDMVAFRSLTLQVHPK
jgi:hypothetical protein